MSSCCASDSTVASNFLIAINYESLEQTSEHLLAINYGTLYPALLKLEQEEFITSEWGLV
jgi:hypothetical protein